VIFITLGSDPPPLESDKNIFYFLGYYGKWFFAPTKAEKFSKFAKNEVKAIKGAVSTAMRDVSAAPHGMSVAPRGVLAAPRGMSATPCGMLAGQDTPGA